MSRGRPWWTAPEFCVIMVTDIDTPREKSKGRTLDEPGSVAGKKGGTVHGEIETKTLFLGTLAGETGIIHTYP